ncbi:hypothetical protein HPP92_008809 [Vanilla planifolia]|uniref:Late embryogenesis abundant protein LEA-2 subgroup domain-containing protein n=1 Tax=Vanilla planifolia TaxID=51239 RepID=A0A835V440_VANPL|nr:hypothetical protein HPP92_009039 [Vanilla planifolia]KAG0486714.1 hypothetical protein HPP92_008809 [Vanilla planifolia]
MTKKDDDHGYCKRRRIIRRLVFAIVFFIILILLAILIVWLVLRPTKPRFYLQDARVVDFNLSAPNLLSSTLQITISSRNPNERIGIYYDRLDVYAAYKNQQITPAYSIPGLYQGHKDIDVWSPYLSGSFVPIAPYLCTSLTQDEANGFLFLYVKIDGRLRWKVGSWISGHYHIFVECPAFLTFDNKAGGPIIRFQQMSTCSVEV